ncbi:hypothetical protein C0991_000992 [Blastosporella zonata]|nr:hypothetical protein C0991_000992 [Blastosporella zonata]
MGKWGQLGLSGFLREQLTPVPPVVKADLEGKTVIVIGANTGLGFEACRHFARMNPTRLILACRSTVKGEAAVEKLHSETEYKAELWIVDLSDFASVIAFGDRFEKDGGRLDVFVGNAAIATDIYTTTSDGWETTLQINCLSLFLLALRLLPQMIKTSTEHGTHPRLVIVTSDLHFGSKFPENVPTDDIYKTMSSPDYCTPAVMTSRYPDSKLFNILFSQALNERLGADSPVIVTSVNPGFCLSELRREISGLASIMVGLMEKVVARTSEQGGRQLAYAAVGSADNEDQLRGAYISSARLSKASDFATGPEGHAVQDRLWVRRTHVLQASRSALTGIYRKK